MAARTPSIHVYLGRPLFLLSPGIHSRGKYIREEKEKGTRGDKNADKLQYKREVSIFEASVLIRIIKYCILGRGDAVA
jgi:hypothetical protein